MKLGNILFVIGGARSGKSSYAVQRAQSYGDKVAFIATCIPRDHEMRDRITLHQQNRPHHWETFETENSLIPLITHIKPGFNAIIIDCLTLYISNLMHQDFSDESIEKNITQVLELLEKKPYRSIIISNEVGLGLVPDNELGRRFRDVAGRINQITVQHAHEVVCMFSGLPFTLKGGNVHGKITSHSGKNQRS